MRWLQLPLSRRLSEGKILPRRAPWRWYCRPLLAFVEISGTLAPHHSGPPPPLGGCRACQAHPWCPVRPPCWRRRDECLLSARL